MRTYGPISLVVVASSLAMGCTKTEEPAHVMQKSEASMTDAKAESAPAEGTTTLAVGERAPDFTVEILGGELLKLSEHLRATGGPTILLFDRAHW